MRVGAQHLSFTISIAQVAQESLKSSVVVVELMVTQCERVEAYGVHGLRVSFSLSEGVVQVAGNRVTRFDFYGVCPCCRKFFHNRGNACESAQRHIDALAYARRSGKPQWDGFGVQMGVVIVDVQKRDTEFCGRAVGACRGGPGGIWLWPGAPGKKCD